MLGILNKIQKNTHRKLRLKFTQNFFSNIALQKKRELSLLKIKLGFKKEC